jgi:hypothetical protein
MSDAWSMPPADAPPPYRSMSALAVIALVLSIVFLLGAVLGFWWLELVPVLLCVAAWGGISAGRKRGGGLAIAAALVAILGGLGSFACHRAVRTGVRDVVGEFVAALHRDDLATLERWATKDETKPFPERAALWKQRLDAGRAVTGAWTNDVELKGNLFFPMAWVVPMAPPGLVPVGPKAETTEEESGMKLWVRAPGARAELWLALHVNARDLQDVSQKKPGGETVTTADIRDVVSDVTVHVPADAK